jgi:predicted DNA-binding transcriptional regulator YafY
MRRADRLLQIIQILRRYRHPVRGKVIADELEVALRTVYRDIADLMTQGVPIRGEAGIGYILEKGYDLPPLMFTADEIEAVILGLGFVAWRGDKVLKKAAKDTIAKIGVVLPKDLAQLLNETALIVPPNWKQVDDKVDLSLIRRAIREQRKVALRYKDEGGAASMRVIWPLAISYLNDLRIVISWCELRQDFRHFRADRMGEIEITQDKYKASRRTLMKKWSESEACAELDGVSEPLEARNGRIAASA